MKTIQLLTQGHNDTINITEQVRTIVAESGVRSGLVHVFLTSTTSALTIMEDEAGAKLDLVNALERLIPEKADYAHNAKWGDMNGYAHVRSALMKPFVTVPVHEGTLQLGKWQSILLIDFDNQPRNRTLHVTISADVSS
jgi:secondary thiamine-phosphate synthase enzyme